MTSRGVQTQLTEERVAKAEEIFAALDGEDLRLNGCACNESTRCYLHGYELPVAVETWRALADAYLAQQRVIEAADALLDEAKNVTRLGVVATRPAFDRLAAALAAVSVGSSETRETEE